MTLEANGTSEEGWAQDHLNLHWSTSIETKTLHHKIKVLIQPPVRLLQCPELCWSVNSLSSMVLLLITQHPGLQGCCQIFELRYKNRIFPPLLLSPSLSLPGQSGTSLMECAAKSQSHVCSSRRPLAWKWQWCHYKHFPLSHFSRTVSIFMTLSWDLQEIKLSWCYFEPWCHGISI